MLRFYQSQLPNTTSVVLSDQRSVGHMIDDKLIAKKIKQNYLNIVMPTCFLSVGVTVLEGRVLLTGSYITIILMKL